MVENNTKKISDVKPNVMEWLEDVIVVDEAMEPSPKDIVNKEYQRYLAALVSKEDPLTWWKRRESVYPTLSKMAKKYLQIPASRIPSERIFSLAGTIVSKKRASLSPENVDMLIFLKKNYKNFK